MDAYCCVHCAKCAGEGNKGSHCAQIVLHCQGPQYSPHLTGIQWQVFSKGCRAASEAVLRMPAANPDFSLYPVDKDKGARATYELRNPQKQVGQGKSRVACRVPLKHTWMHMQTRWMAATCQQQQAKLTWWVSAGCLIVCVHDLRLPRCRCAGPRCTPRGAVWGSFWRLPGTLPAGPTAERQRPQLRAE